MGICARERLTGNRTYYVRTDGNDNNDGLADSATRAFLTIQRAVDVACNDIDAGPYNVTIQVGDGTYAAGVSLKNYVGTGTFTLKGNTASPANTVISATNTNAISIGTGIRPWTVQDLTLQTNTGGHGILASGGRLLFTNLRFGTTAWNHINSTIGASISAQGNYSIVGGAVAHAVAESGASVLIVGRTITLTGTPAFSTAFAFAEECGSITISGDTFSGSATGPRYVSQINGVINTNGGGANYLPGNSAGSTATGGQYV